MTRRIEDFLTLDTAALAELPLADQFAVLGDLAERAGPWLRDHRGNVVDQLRAELGGDQAVSEALEVSTQWLADLGDGPTVAGGYKPRLLRRGAELLLQHLRPGSTSVAHNAAMKAFELVAAKGRPNTQNIWSAAVRMVQAASSVDRSGLADDEEAVLARAIAHAAWVKAHPPR